MGKPSLESRYNLNLYLAMSDQYIDHINLINDNHKGAEKDIQRIFEWYKDKEDISEFLSINKEQLKKMTMLTDDQIEGLTLTKE